MQDVATVRRAALDAVGDVTPEPLRKRIEDHLSARSLVPGVFTLRSVRAVAGRPDTEPDGMSPDSVATRAAGVQLIYDGLALTRQLSQDEPWTDGMAAADDGDLAVLAADVLVARGFYLLSRTEAADAAVDVVRAFGRDQTVRRETGDPDLDRSLEADVLELAVVAGTTAAGSQTTPRLREFAAGLATTAPFAAAEEFFDPGVSERLVTLGAETPATEGVPTSLDD